MESSKIKEDRYFRSIIHEDIDEITLDLRTKHKKDTLSANDISATLDYARVINEVQTFKGTFEEKQSFFLFGMLGIDVRKLKPKEQELLLKVVKKSKHFWKKK